MKRPMFTLHSGALVAIAFLLVMSTSSSQAPAPNKSAPVSCSVRHTPSTEADIAFSHAKYDDAIALYRKEAGASGEEGERIHNALIRSEIRAQKVDDAAADAKAWAASSPKDAWALTSLGEVQFRNGEIDDAGKSMRAAAAANFCVAQVHADYAIYLAFVGFSASAKTQLDIAHKLDPIDDQISGDWTNSQPRNMRAAAIDAYIAHTPFLTDKERASWENAKEQLNKAPLYPCRLTSSVTSTTIPFHGIRSGATRTNIAWGLSVAFNGVQRRLEIDTGASGLLLNHSAATDLGLQIESRTKSSGFGDEGAVGTSVALVKHLKIGDLVFEDCAVRVLDKDQMPNQDGLIGGDVFRNFLLTIDFPGRVLKLDPLPVPPGVDAASVDNSMQTGVSADDSTPRDRYVDPSMSSWTTVFRLGHNLLLPVRLNNGPTHLFIVDTGNYTNLISVKAAREVSHVQRGSVQGLRGISGEATHLYDTGPLTLDFAGLRQPSDGLTAMELTKFGGAAVEVSGFLGSPTLHQLTIKIDYRDQLMKFTYDPSRLVHCAQGMALEDCY